MVLTNDKIASNNQNSANSTRSTGTKNSTHNFGLIMACGLPWKTSKADVVRTFANFNILNGEHGVHFIVDEDSNHNNAFIQLSSSKDATFILERKQMLMANILVKSMRARIQALNGILHKQCTKFEFYFQSKRQILDILWICLNTHCIRWISEWFVWNLCHWIVLNRIFSNTSTVRSPFLVISNLSWTNNVLQIFFCKQDDRLQKFIWFTMIINLSVKHL